MTLPVSIEPRPRRERVPRVAMGDMVWIPGRTFIMGSNAHYREERPAHAVAVRGFWMDIAPVTNERFARFVDATGYVTVAERLPRERDDVNALPSILRPGSLVFVKPEGPVANDSRNWWHYVAGANWRHPRGPGSSLDGRAKHPVVHVAYEDAHAFAHWEGKQLPTEPEWELACRGGLEGATYAWGDALMPDGRPMANYWQGEFPHENLLLDGWEATSPVDQFPPNKYGLYDMIGNVWEWTSDWYAPRHRAAAPAANHGRGSSDDDEQVSDPETARKVLKGGSFLCSRNFSQRYRPAARWPESVYATKCDVGFRCIVRP